jgi:hypothetical protein
VLTQAHRKECLSLAFIHALSGFAGSGLDSPRVHDYGVDGTWREIKTQGTRHVESGFAVDFQLKATTNWSLADDNIKYDLEVKTYNDFVERDATAIHIILAVLCLPKLENQWIACSEDELIIRRCCYWTRVIGKRSRARSTKRILIPRTNLLSPEAIRMFLAEARTSAGVS